MNVMKQDKQTRRQVLRTGVAAVGGGILAAGARPSAAVAQDKIDPKMVQYQTTPKDGNKCSICVNFEAPSSCKIVSGTISPDGWCIAFGPKNA
jgi:hypothetical protein